MRDPRALTEIAMSWAAIAAFCDLRTRKIPNWLTLSAIPLGLLLNVILSGSGGLRASVLGTLVGLALLFVPFAMGGMGAGDVKMLAAVGAIAGPTVAFRSFVYGAVAGGLMAAAVLTGRLYLLRGRSVPASGGPVPSVSRWGSRDSLPYGIAIFIGTVIAYAVR